MSDEGEKRAGTEELVPIVYQELRELARGYFRNQRPGFTLRPTELVNEACLHLLQHAPGPWDTPEHFRAIATHKVWQIVVDHLKRRHADKRGGGRRPAQGAEGSKRWRRVPLDDVLVEWHDRPVELLDLADALDALAKEHTRLSDVVMLHWFGGLKYAEVARVLGVSASTVEKDFRYALAWLSRRMEGSDSHG